MKRALGDISSDSEVHDVVEDGNGNLNDHPTKQKATTPSEESAVVATQQSKPDGDHSQSELYLVEITLTNGEKETVDVSTEKGATRAITEMPINHRRDDRSYRQGQRSRQACQDNIRSCTGV
jgi:hypothetical protein